jgi:signal transduction histidine kinase/ActR/RegA family two-component response regulator
MKTGAIPKELPSLGLRTKFLLSLVLTTAGLSCATLLVVRHTAKKHLEQEIATDASNSAMTLQLLLHQREALLGRKASLLAALASVTLDDDPTLQNSADNPLDAEGNDLVILADGSNRITALHSTNPGFKTADAQQLVLHSAGRVGGDWWYAAGSLYQIVVQHVENHSAETGRSRETVVVGRELGYSAVHDLGRVSASEVAFSYQGDIAASTLMPLDEGDLRARMRAAPQLGDVRIGGEEFYGVSLPLMKGSSPPARIVVLKSYRAAAAFLSEINRLLIGLAGLALVAVMWLAFFISETFTRPLAKLDKGVQALEKGDFDFPLDARGGDEVARVTRAFDHMRGTLQKNELQKRKLEEDLRQSQKMDALGRLAGGVAHDFNNLLTVIKGHTELMIERMQPADPLLGSGQQIRSAADRAASLTRQMLAFSRRQALEPTVFDMNVLVTDMCKLLKRLIHEDVEFSFRADDSLGKVKADTGQIEQVVLNLAVNACDAMPQGGKLTIETKNVFVGEEYARMRPTVPPGNYAVLSVTDTGHGMDEETKARMFEPFFTTKENGKGTGLGLATVYGVVKQSDGFIWVDTAPGRGCRFDVYLPQVRQTVAEPLRAEKTRTVLTRATETVLLAEDEDAVRDLACEFLSAAGYRVFAAENGEKALKIAETLSQPIHLLVTDVVMPRMRGTELAKKLRDLQPNMKVIYMSGYLGEEGSDEFLKDSEYLQKPFSRDMLLHRAGVSLSESAVLAGV